MGSVAELSAARRLEAHLDAEAFLTDLAARLMRCSDDGLPATLMHGLEGLGRRSGAFICRVMDHQHAGERLVERLRWEDLTQTRPQTATSRAAPVELRHVAPGDCIITARRASPHRQA
ncbi:MAG: hypothetical protein IPO67_21075 [Deltaproteobacteria bacterium]|nr:hypothetical protein [Deltaproteobacteria bacterium]